MTEPPDPPRSAPSTPRIRDRDRDRDDAPHLALPAGLYDHLRTLALEHAVNNSLGDPRLAQWADVDPEDAHTAIAQYLERLIVDALASLRGRERMETQRRVVDRMLAALAEELGSTWQDHANLADPLRRLLAVHTPGHPAAPDTAAAILHDDAAEARGLLAIRPPDRPDTPLARSALLTGTRIDPSLASQLSKEIAHADRIDILCSFIKWSGLRLLLDALRHLTATPCPEVDFATGKPLPRLRIITTSYMGATDHEAVEVLRDLPNTEVKVSYDTARTRLHAKAYLVHRRTNFGSAYVGSANISKAALSEGLEWTSKISQYELPHLWQKVVATFENYWNDDEFETFDLAATPRLIEAIRRERAGEHGRIGETGPLPAFDLRPYPFQEEILDRLAAEREVQGRRRHLVVAATGTGKTMIAAFDYRRFARDLRNEQSSPADAGAASSSLSSSSAARADFPSLLFIAHREEILRQALGTFRAVLRDQNFGDLLVGGRTPAQLRHLFCSIQTWNSRGLARSLPADHFDYIVVDEFHHAPADSYQSLLDTAQPKILLGLTATPERADGRSVFEWFGGEASAEIRLPDAIQRRLLCPFQYFGVSDTVDLDSLQWQRGGYRTEDLDTLYTGNDVRAGMIVDKVHEILRTPHRARGLGFCVSVAHAHFMARFFNAHGLPAIALSGQSSDEERLSAQARLRQRDINFIFTVDLYNEGVDIPEVDTVLFLRPTESLTVYLQQFGRGLRLHDEKECLTVLDFIGAQRREFRFASRFRALSTNPAGKMDREIEADFPHLPAGCAIRLERIAKERVLDNVRQTLALHRPRIVRDLAELGGALGQPPSLREALDVLGIPLGNLLKRGLWSRLLADANLIPAITDPDEGTLARGIARLAHIDDPRHLQYLLNWLERLGGAQTENHPLPPMPADASAATPAAAAETINLRRLHMLHIVLWGPDGAQRFESLEEANEQLRRNPAAVRDLQAIFAHRLAHTSTRVGEQYADLTGPLAVHARYSRDEILAGLGHWTFTRRPRHSEGALHLADRKADVFFITLHKTEDAYSPTTMYEDYAISDRLFHWQSQSTTSIDSPTGRRYVHHREMGFTPLLFAREHRTDPETAQTAPYTYLGPADHVSQEGTNPISIVWRLRHPMPARVVRASSAVG